jgi:hypothetical protein
LVQAAIEGRWLIDGADIEDDRLVTQAHRIAGLDEALTFHAQSDKTAGEGQWR